MNWEEKSELSLPTAKEAFREAKKTPLIILPFFT